MKIAILYQNNKPDIMLNRMLDRDVANNLFWFDDEEECCDYLKKTVADVLLLECPDNEEGIRKTLGFLKENKLKTVVCLVGENEMQCITAYRLKCDYFIQDELSQEDYDRIMEAVSLIAIRVKKLKIVTFGSFEVFVNNIPIYFRSSKAKELLALCVDRRGSVVKMTEAINLLWPEKAYDEKVKRLYRKAIMSLRSVLSQYGAENLLQTVRGGCRIDPNTVKCDYYSFLENPRRYRYLFNGLYMYDYLWGERSLSGLLRLAKAAGRGHTLKAF